MNFYKFSQLVLWLFDWPSVFGMSINTLDTLPNPQCTFEVFCSANDTQMTPFTTAATNLRAGPRATRVPCLRILSKAARRAVQALIMKKAPLFRGQLGKRCSPGTRHAGLDTVAVISKPLQAWTPNQNWMRNLGVPPPNPPSGPAPPPRPRRFCPKCHGKRRCRSYQKSKLTMWDGPVPRNPARAQAPGHAATCFPVAWKKTGEEWLEKTPPPRCITQRAEDLEGAIGRGEVEDCEQRTLGDVFGPAAVGRMRVPRCRLKVSLGDGMSSSLGSLVHWVSLVMSVGRPQGCEPGEAASTGACRESGVGDNGILEPQQPSVVVEGLTTPRRVYDDQLQSDDQSDSAMDLDSPGLDGT